MIRHGELCCVKVRSMSKVLLRYSDLKAKGLQWSKAHIYRLEKAGQFPRRVRIGANKFGYVEREIDEHIAALIAARDAAGDVPMKAAAARRHGKQQHHGGVTR
jgi:prophage regulatory protein